VLVGYVALAFVLPVLSDPILRFVLGTSGGGAPLFRARSLDSGPGPVRQTSESPPTWTYPTSSNRPVGVGWGVTLENRLAGDQWVYLFV